MSLSSEILETLQACSKDEAALQTLIALVECDQQQPDYLRALFQSPNHIHFVLDTDCRIIDMNSAAYQQTEAIWSKAPAPGDSFLDYVVPVSLKRFRNYFQRCLQGERITYEHQMTHPNGVEGWYEFTYTPVYSREGVVIGVCFSATDITRQRQSESRFQAIFDGANMGISVTTYPGRVVAANPACAELLGYSIDELKTMSYQDYTHPDDLGIDMALFDQLRNGEISNYRLEKRYIRKNGEHLWVQVNISLFPGGEAGEKLVIATIDDITERKRAEAALRESEQRLELALKGADLGLWDWVIDTDYKVINARWAEMLGYTMAEVPPNNTFWREHIHPDDLEHVMTITEKHLTGKLPIYALEYRLRAKDGSYKWILARGKVVEWWPDGRPRRMAGTHLDITEQKTIEAALRESESLFSQIMENIHEVFYIRDPVQNKLVYISPAYETLWGRPLEAIYANNADFLEAIHPDDRPAVIAALSAEVNGSGEPFSMEYRIIRPDGDERLIWARNIPLYDESGEMYRLIGIAEDITARRRHEDHKLNWALERERMRILSNFIQDASHEFRTPLSIINTKLYLLERAVDPEQRRVHIAGIYEQVESIVALLESLVMMSRLDQDFGVHLSPIHLHDVLRSLARGEEIASEKGINLSYEWAESLPLVQGDFEGLRQALWNLLENALRFTPAGGSVTVRTRTAAGQAVVEIEDTGAGISREDLAHIFESFYRADTAHTTRGFGLGLSITRRIIEQHGGDVSAQSEKGKGTIFRVMLPAITL